jgi:nanoRNase/pAp phosphatase (c-di-AMP/oligoRNAs hydrolase)
LAKLCVINEKASSTCEIIYSFFREIGIKPDRNEALALFLGIAFDTRHFILAGSSTFKVIAELITLGVDPQKTMFLLSLPMEFSERIGRLKAARRVKLFKIGDWIVALSHVSAYQASAARAMIELGAHVAIVAGKKKKKVQISLRCTRDFLEKTQIHLGRDIAKPAGEYLQGMGGGHPTAAGINGKGDLKTGLKHCLELLKGKVAIQE